MARRTRRTGALPPPVCSGPGAAVQASETKHPRPFGRYFSCHRREAELRPEPKFWRSTWSGPTLAAFLAAVQERRALETPCRNAASASGSRPAGTDAPARVGRQSWARSAAPAGSPRRWGPLNLHRPRPSSSVITSSCESAPGWPAATYSRWLCSTASASAASRSYADLHFGGVKGAGISNRRGFAGLADLPRLERVSPDALERAQRKARLQVASEDDGITQYELPSSPGRPRRACCRDRR